MKSPKTHKRHGTLRTDLHARKKPTVAKRVNEEFKSKRVRPTSKERIMAKASKEYDEPTEEVAAESVPAATEDDVHQQIDNLIEVMELSYVHAGPTTQWMVEQVRKIHDAIP